MWVRSLGQEDPLEEGMATTSNILAWRIPRTKEPDGLQSMGLQSRTRLKRSGSQAKAHSARSHHNHPGLLNRGQRLPTCALFPEAVTS